MSVVTSVVGTVSPWVRNGPGLALSLSVRASSGAPTWQVILETSHDRVNLADPILTHTDLSPGDGQTMFSGAQKFKVPWRRIRIAALSGGTIQVDHDG
jgi:hypothetical protein